MQNLLAYSLWKILLESTAIYNHYLELSADSGFCCRFIVGVSLILFEPGKERMVEEIYFLGKDYINLEEQEPTTWGVTGRKINKDGKYGKKKFKPVSNASHVVKGKRCKRKTLNEEFGIEESS